MMKKLAPILLLSVLCGSPLLASESSDADLATQLRAQDEKLLSAVHRGQRAVWEEAVTEDFVYVEEGQVVPRDTFLRDLAEDGSAPLVIRDFHLHRSGDTAVVIHTDAVPPSLWTPRAGYLMTETWQRLGGRWKLRIVHIDAVHADPPAVALKPEELDRLAGTYRSGEATIDIVRQGAVLRQRRPGRPDQELVAETPDVFYTPGQTRMRTIFRHDAAGAVTALVMRNENSDRVWQRAGSQAPAE